LNNYFLSYLTSKKFKHLEEPNNYLDDFKTNSELKFFIFEQDLMENLPEKETELFEIIFTFFKAKDDNLSLLVSNLLLILHQNKVFFPSIYHEDYKKIIYHRISSPPLVRLITFK